MVSSLFLLSLLLAGANPITTESTQEFTRVWKNVTQRKWVSQIMAEVLPDFRPSSTTNLECDRQSRLYTSHLRNLTLWAVQMLDSSMLSENSLLYGDKYNFGGYDQCIRLTVPELGLKGKHCLAHMQFSPTDFNIEEKQSYTEYDNVSPLDTVWKKIKHVRHQRVRSRDRFFWSICIPAGCSNKDLQESLSGTLQKAFKQSQMTVKISVDQTLCTVGEFPLEYTTGQVIFFSFIFALMLVVAVSSALHYYYYDSYSTEKEDSSFQLMFSVISNTKLLLRPESNEKLQFLSGVKVMSMFIIIYGHRMLMSMYWPLLNVEELEQTFSNMLQIINYNGQIIVNTFLITTGFLVFNKLLNDIKKERKINIILYIFYKWARVTPVVVLVISGYIYYGDTLRNEPLYRHESLWRKNACIRNLWSYILYVNNYYDPASECILPAWYLAVDMQLFVVCVVTGYVMSKSKLSGYILLGILFMASVIGPGIESYYNGYDAILKFYFDYLSYYYKQDQYVRAYIPTHMRAMPYIAGMATALILKKLQKKGYTFTVTQRVIVLSCAAFVAVSSLMYAWIFYIPDRESSYLENSIYITGHKIFWSLAISLLVLIGANDGFGKLTIILSSSIFIPFNKLMLTVLLIHPLVQGQTFLLSRSPEYVTLVMTVWRTCGDILFSYFISYVIHLIYVSPTTRLLDCSMKMLFLKKVE